MLSKLSQSSQFWITLALVVAVHLLIIFVALMDYQTMDPATLKENVEEREVAASESPCDEKDLTGKNREVVGDRDLEPCLNGLPT